MPAIGGATLRAWRRSCGWDVPEMARQLRRAARDTGQAIAAHEGLVRMIRDWERGTHQLTERYQLLYAAALGIEPDQLVRGPDGSRDPNDVAGDEMVARAMLPATREDGYPGRLDHVLTHPEITDLIAVAQLREHVRRLDERYDSFPASALIAEAGRRLGQIEFLAAHARRSDVRRELRGAEAEAAVLMGQLVWDASQRRAQDTAATYLRQAVDAARQRGDHACEGLALLRSSMVDLYGRKDPRSGRQVAQQAVAAGGRVSKVLAGLATLHTAEAHAMQGDRAGCGKALGQAEAHFGQVTPEDPAIDLYSGAQFGRMAGSCYLFLGDAAAAAAVLEQTAVALRDGSKAEAIVLGNLALARIRLGRIDEAVAVLHKTLDVVQVNWGGGGLNIAFTAGREMRRWQDTTAVRDVRDRLLALMAEA